MTAIMQTAKQNVDILRTLKTHIGMGLGTENIEDMSLELQIRIAEISAEFNAMVKQISTDNMENFDDSKATQLINEKSQLENQLAQIQDTKQKR